MALLQLFSDFIVLNKHQKKLVSFSMIDANILWTVFFQTQIKHIKVIIEKHHSLPNYE